MNKINHKSLWFNSMTGMTIGFIGTLIVGTIIGIFGMYSNDNIFVTIKKAMTFITTFGIGIGIAVKHKLNPIQILATGLAAFIVGKSLMIPHYISATDSFSYTDVHANIDLRMLPGDVFASWLAGVGMLYFFEFYKKQLSLDLFIIPIIGILLGIFGAMWITYITTYITGILEWVINKTINRSLTAGLLLAPIFGAIIGLALSLPTSSAAMAFALHLKGDAAIVAIAATSAQMISFGVMTYMSTRSVSKSMAVGFGTTMLQINNFTKKPILLLIPTLMSMLIPMISLGIFHGTLGFLPLGKAQRSVTSGMGSSGLYGQIFTLRENGWTNSNAWLNIVFMQLIAPALFTIPLAYWFKKKGYISKQMLMY